MYVCVYSVCTFSTVNKVDDIYISVEVPFIKEVGQKSLSLLKSHVYFSKFPMIFSEQLFSQNRNEYAIFLTVTFTTPKRSKVYKFHVTEG